MKYEKTCSVNEMSRIMKTGLCLCDDKGAYQLFSHCTADQCLWFRCTGRFMSNLVGNPEDRFSRVAAQLEPSVERAVFSS